MPQKKVAKLKDWLLSHPSHRFVAFQRILSFAPDLQLSEYESESESEAVRTAFRSLGYGRRNCVSALQTSQHAELSVQRNYMFQCFRDGLGHGF